MRFLCRVGWHRWQYGVRVHSFNYFTCTQRIDRCRRCDTERSRIVR